MWGKKESFSISIDLTQVEKAEKLLVSRGPKALQSAITRSLKSGVSAFKSSKKGGAPDIYKVSSGELKEFASVKKDQIVIKSRLLTAGKKPAHFAITPGSYTGKRRKATVKVKKQGSKENLPHAFVANPAKVNGGTTMLWERTRGRFPHTGNAAMEPVRRVSAAQMVQNPQVENAVMKAIQETFDKRLDHELERLGK